jgi:hypothetical protein
MWDLLTNPCFMFIFVLLWMGWALKTGAEAVVKTKEGRSFLAGFLREWFSNDDD